VAKKAFKCSNCNQVFTRWDAQCANCGEIDTLDEVSTSLLATKKEDTKVGSRAERVSSGDSPALIKDIDANKSYQRIKSGIGELDRVLGGGFVPGGIILLAGEPGVGKSSITNLIASEASRGGRKVLIVSGEETKEQIKSRLNRINAHTENFYLLAENNLNNVKNHINELVPELLIVDSVQTLVSDTSEGRVGSVAQVTEVAQEMTQIGKRLGIPTILIGHVTKDGNIAGPRVVEHLVDTVLYFEGSRDSPLKLLKGIKNRFGATDEIGCFEHTEDGLIEVSDPSGFFLSEHAEGTVGYATSVIVEGNRALPIEVQALVTETALPNPRRVNHGLDNPRVLMIQAILEKHGGIRLQNKDIYVSTTGGLTSKDTSIDLAVAAAIISSYYDCAVPEHSVILGETTLTGEIKHARDSNKRFMEAYRLGFTTIISPSKPSDDNNSKTPYKIDSVRYIRDLIEKIQATEE
jgi:DNA repair protein RadA/Sms